MRKRSNQADRGLARNSSAKNIHGFREPLVSPVLQRVLCKPTNFSFKTSVILAKLDRVEIGDFDALVLGLLFMAHYKG
jgi:hypothetical protein